MNKNLIIGIILILIIAGGAFFIFKDTLMPTKPAAEIINNTQPAAGSSVTETPSSVAVESTDSSKEGVKEFTITASNFKFDTPEIRVKKGDTVKINFKNSGGFHDFVIDEFNIKTKQGNGPSEETVTFVADKLGQYAFYCSVGQHRANGMEGKFIVE